MNAYELADCLEGMADFDGCEYQQAADMLRQQADRIAELEKKTEYYWDGQPDNAVIIRAMPKPLSDEEITEIVADKYAKGHGRYIDTDLFFIEFARAIEAKVRGQ